MVEVITVPMALVYPRVDGRPVVKGHAETLALSMKAIGLQSPITVRSCTRTRDGRDAEAFEIVAGRHRYEAAKSLNWSEINAFVMEGEPDDLELWEIDENFARAELTEAQKADHHARRRRILLDKGLVSDKRGPKLSSHGKVYSQEAAEALGVSPHSINKHVWRGTKIDPDVLAEVTGTDLDNRTVLDSLAATPREDQPAKLIALRQERQVRPAADPLDDHDAHEKQLADLMAAWNRAAAVVRQEFLLRIDEPVFDKGRAA